jgi:DNA-binding LacI/PurR family transcriptional regulator
VDAALGAGLDIPGDVAIVGIENEEIVCLNPDPSISSVELPSIAWAGGRIRVTTVEF